MRSIVSDISELFGRVKALEEKLGVTHIPKGLKIGDEFELADTNWKILGAFGENLIVDGYDFRNLPVGTKFRCNDVLLEMTQIGKECHSHCEIYKVVGDCIMPREGVFAKVLEGGTIKVGDELVIVE